MTYTVNINQIDGQPVVRGPDLYGTGGATLYTGSGPLWRTKIVNWEDEGGNAASNPNPQPTPDPCVSDPINTVICV